MFDVERGAKLNAEEPVKQVLFCRVFLGERGAPDSRDLLSPVVRVWCSSFASRFSEKRRKLTPDLQAKCREKLDY